MQFEVTKEMQLKELQDRVPPILNVDIVVFKENKENLYLEPQFLIGRRNRDNMSGNQEKRLFPGGRMHFDESPQDAALRILNKELPGVSAKLKKLITAQSDKGTDRRSYGVTLFFLFEYIGGYPIPNDDLDKFIRLNSNATKKLENMYVKNIDILSDIESTIRSMNNSQDELLVEVDKDNNEIGIIEKRKAHNTNERYHRAAHIMLFNTKGEVVLQKRSPNKATNPGSRDMPGGHNAAGHTIEQTAAEELMEEMGVSVDLVLHDIGLKITDTQAEYYYLYYGVSDGPYGFDKNEVDQILSVDCEDLITGKYDKDMKILNHVKIYTEQLRFYREELKSLNT